MASDSHDLDGGADRRERICWKGSCYEPHSGYVRAWWTLADFVSYATCSAHAMQGMEILSASTVDGELPVAVEWASAAWLAEL